MAEARPLDNVLQAIGLLPLVTQLETLMQSPEFQAAMPVMGMALGPMTAGGINLSSTGGGARAFDLPYQSVKAAKAGINPATTIEAGKPSVLEALTKSRGLFQDPIAQQRIGDLIKMLGGQ
jgi:hypothetical protein